MSSPTFHYRARLSFPDATRSLIETGRTMARFAELAVEVLAPELHWESAVLEHADFGVLERWESSHVVRYAGTDDAGTTRARGESRLTAGGRGSAVGGTGRIVVETIQPVRHLTIQNPCDVSHWDIDAGPLTEAQIEALRRCLEGVLGDRARPAGDRRDAVEPGAWTLVRGVSREDAALWREDLRACGLEARTDPEEDTVTLVLERATLADLEALHEARVTIGEVLSEAGHDDWEAQARWALMVLPWA